VVIQSTDLHFDTDILTATKKAKKEVRELITSLFSGTAIVQYKGQIISAKPIDFPRLLVEWQGNSTIDHNLRSIIVSALLSGEEKASGTSLLASGIWSSDSNIQKIISKNKRCSYYDVKKMSRFLAGEGMTSAAAGAVIRMGGLGHNVDYTENTGKASLVTVFAGKEILGHIDLLFGDKCGHLHDLQDCAVIAIDGTVETVSSIHSILESSTSRPIIIIARNILPDVSNTMAETFLRKRGVCIPFISTDWKVENFLDLEKIGIRCVSNERGDTVSVVSAADIMSCQASITERKFLAKFSDCSDRTKIEVSISKSLGGLTGLALDRTKMIVGFARIASRSGVFRWEDLREESEKLSGLYSKDLVLPCYSLESALRSNQSLSKILQDLGCVITVQKGEK